MVRVITVHNFSSQHVQTVEQPTASTVAPPDRLLLALSNHCVEVRDLKTEANLLFTFPTVDQVAQLLHCLNGDYVATLETKFNRQNREMNYVRVYVNWDNIATLQQSKMTSSGASLDSSECGMVQPMRARIAGRVTPTTNQSELGSLEMIEIPVRLNPTTIACCQISGNILIQSDRVLTLYAFQIKTHDISKLRFIDFEEFPFYIEISFVPLKVSLCENYVACLNKDSMHMFKIMWKPHTASDKTKDPEKCDTNFKFPREDVTIDYRELLRKEGLNNIDDKITVNLPSVVKSNSLIHKHSPFTYTDKEMNAIIRHNFPVEDKSHNYEIVHLIQLKLKPIIIENSQTQVVEEFKCLLVKPLYCDGNPKRSDNPDCYRLLKSSYRNYLSGVVCLITTLQEGYLFQFCDAETNVNSDHCISVYPFMGPIYNIVLEDHLLHALTETGLESYTVRIGHKLCRNLEIIDELNNACPPVEQLICLIGHRQFLGVEQTLLADNYLVLLANADNSPTHSVGSNSSSNASYWTLYNLELPTPKMIFTDIAIAANAHRFSAPQTYCHLMSEAHMILRLSLMLTKWCIREGNVSSLIPIKHNIEDLVEAYRTSCCLLGDHFILSETNYKLCLPYYRMAGIAAHEVLKRFRKIQDESNLDEMQGILFYLKMVLTEPKFKSPDDLTTAVWKQNFIEEVLRVFENQNFKDLGYLILKNSMLREYSTYKFINVLMHQSYADPQKETEKLLALTLLYVQEYNIDEAKNMINYINNNSSLYRLLLDNWKLLFECSVSPSHKHKATLTFSEFSVILMFTCGELLSEVFVTLIMEERVTLHDLLKMFIEYLPLNMGPDGNAAAKVMRKVLEEYFKIYFKNYEVEELPKFASSGPFSLRQAMTVLVRSYLSQLQMIRLKEANTEPSTEKINVENTNEETPESDEAPSNTSSDLKTSKQSRDNKPLFPKPVMKQKLGDFLFSDLRFEYLDRMPPFQVEITSKLYETCIANYVAKDACLVNEEANLTLQKLQALFCSRVLPEEAVTEAITFLTLNKALRGYTSLKSILMSTNDAVPYLLNACPQCLLQYGKDCFTRGEDWKCLIISIQRKIIGLANDLNLKRVCFFYKKLLKDVLTHLATTMHVEHFQQVLPHRNAKLSTDSTSGLIQKGDSKNADDSETCDDAILDEIYSYDTYIVVCKETIHANQIKKLITTTGQQLLCTLNL